MTPGSTVTVVIASRDRPDMARRAVSCALAQVGAPVEVVLVDDASVTPLAVSLEDLVERVGPRLRIVRNEVSLGVSRARNRGIAAARGEWIGFCDDDDAWAPIKVREQLEVARDDQVTWTVSSAMAVAEDNHELKAMRAPSTGDASADLLANNVVPGGASSVIARTAVVRDIGGFDPAFSTLADWELWTRLARTGLLASVHRPLVGYLVHPAGMSNDIKLLESDMAKLERKYHDLRRAEGVVISQRAWMSYIGRMHLKADRRRDAARALSVVARHSDDRSKWKAVVGALLAPQQLLARREALERSNIPPSWWVEFASWFAPLCAGGDPLELWPDEGSLPLHMRAGLAAQVGS